VRDLGLGARVDVVHVRAEELARGPRRGSIDLVTARSFGAPAVTIEAGGALLRPGGRLVMSVVQGSSGPPDIPELGLTAESEWQTENGSFRSYVSVGAADPRYPRRPPAQRRAPLF
jgi:16S rRNA G527 N7-methylase RsmG